MRKSGLESGYGQTGLKVLRLCGAFCLALLLLPSRAGAQSASGFVYNGIHLVSTQPDEYENSMAAAQEMRATGANSAAVVVTQYVQTANSTAIAPETAASAGYSSGMALTPTDAAVVAAIRNLQAQNMAVVLKPLVGSVDSTWSGSFTWPSSDTTTVEQQAWLNAWFASYKTFILHYAQLASENSVGVLTIGTNLRALSGPSCAGASCRAYWKTYVIDPLRAAYPSLTLVYSASAAGVSDEFTTVTFWDLVDIIGVNGYFPLTSGADPSVSDVASAWTNSPALNGFNAVQALKNLASQYSKPLVFMELGYKSTSGANEQPGNGTLNNGYDPTEQSNCYEGFFDAFSTQSSWMKGVFWWTWTVSPPGTSDVGYSPQNKEAGNNLLPAWFGAMNAGFTLTPFSPRLTIGQGLSATDTIAVTPLNGFSGTPSYTLSGMPSGMSASFSQITSAGTVLTLAAGAGEAIQGPVTLTVTGTSGTLTASATISVSVIAPQTQTIAFANPGAQLVGTQLLLAATASSGLPVTFSTTTPGVCTVNSDEAIASVVSAGTCTIVATQAGNSLFSAAAPVSQSFQISSLNPVDVPSNAQIVVYQVNWLKALNGQMLISESPAGTSFGINSNGLLAVADTANLLLTNTRTGVSSTLNWDNASAVAIDPANNIYVSVLFGTVKGIVKLPYTGGTSNNGYAAFSTPASGLATCTSGGTTLCKLPGTVGSMLPGTMAFDASGNLFLAASIGSTLASNSIWKCSAACLNGTASPVEIYSEPVAWPAASSSSGQLVAGALALDSAGNLFFTDSSIYIDPSSSAIYSFYSRLNELPVSTGSGYGGVSTGYAASPLVLYTNTPSAVTAYNAELDGVAVLRDTTSGDTVYFTDKQGGVFAFPDTAGGIPTSGGQPTAIYMVSDQGGKSLGIDAQGNLYIGAYSGTVNTGGADTIAQIALNQVSVPASPLGTAASPSSTLNPVKAILNDAGCTSIPAPLLTFAANASTTASATMATSGSCYTLPSGAARLNIDATFTPLAVGTGSVTLAGTDQAAQTTAVTITGIGSGFTLSASSTSMNLLTGAGSSANTITVNELGGFTGTVSLSLTGLPAGVTASLSPGQTTTSILSLAADSTAAASGPTPITITGVSGSLTQTLTINVTVTPSPTFTVAPATSSLAVVPGSSTTGSIVVTPANGFTGSVTFSVSGLPTGVTASFSPNPATASSTMTLTASSSAAAVGPVTLTVTGVSGSLTQTTTVSLTVMPPPSFTLAASATSLTVGQGSNATDTFTISALNQFSGSVTFSVSGLPAGVTASFSPNPATASSTMTLTDTNSAATTSPVTLTVTGISGSLTQTTTVSLTVMPPPSFTLAASATSLTVGQGNSVTDTFTIAALNNFSGNVTFSVSGLPTGVTASFSPNPTATSSTLTLTASATATAGGPAILTITAVSGSLTQTANVALSVTLPPMFALAPGTTAITMNQGSSATDTILITPANGFSANVNLSIAGLPAGVTASFSPNPATTTSTLTLTASSSAAAMGPVTLTITGVSGTLTQTTVVSLTVTPPPSFSLASSASSLTLTQGSSATDSIAITPANGFAASVTFSVSGLPSGVTASFSPNPATGSSTLTLAATGTATLGGTVALTVTGVSGSLSASATVLVTVVAPANFTLSVSPANLYVSQGYSTAGTLQIAASGGFASSVTLSASGLPAGVTASISPNPATSASTITLTAASSASITGPVTVNVTGVSGSLTRTETFALTVAGPPSFSFSGSPLTVAHGSTTGNTTTITATPVNYFAGTITLGCVVTPQVFNNAPTCSLSPTSLVMDGTTLQTATLTIHTTASNTSQNKIGPLFWPSAGGSVLAVLLLFRAPRRWRKWTAMLGLLAVLAVLGSAGCLTTNGNSSSGGTPTGTYTVTVTGTSGSIWVSNQIQVTVN